MKFVTVFIFLILQTLMDKSNVVQFLSSNHTHWIVWSFKADGETVHLLQECIPEIVLSHVPLLSITVCLQYYLKCPNALQRF